MPIVKAGIAVWLLTLPGLLQAHAFWIEPQEFHLEAPTSTNVLFRVGDGADIEPWNLRWDNIVSLRTYTARGVTDHQAEITPRTEDTEGSADVRFDTAGTHIIAFESQPSFSDLEAARFNPYAEEEGLTAVLAERERNGTTGENGTELYVRRAKALVQVGSETTDNVLQPIGQTLEIVPERNPYTLGDNRQLPVRVLFRGEPLAGALIELIDLAVPEEPLARLRTDAGGRTAFQVPTRGQFLLNVIWSVPIPDDDRAEFDTIFSSLSFGYSDE